MKHILIVDDEPHVIRVLRMALEQSGYLVGDAANGIRALEYLDRLQPDLMITDIDMPQMDGKELCHEICRLYPERQFSIFVLTARAEMEHRLWSREISNLQFMEKPVSIRKLVAQLDNYFSHKNGNEEPLCQSAP